MAAQFTRLGPRYKELGLQTDPAIVAARRQAAQAALDDVTPADTPVLIRAALGLAAPDELDAFVEHFQTEDPTFGPQAGDREVRLLASEVLLEIINGTGKAAPITALGVVTAGFGGVRVYAEEPELQKAALGRLGALQRVDAPKLPTSSKKPDTAQQFATADAHGPNNQFSQAYPALKGLLEAAFDYTERASKHQATQLTEFLSYVKRMEEEMRIQWWVTNGWSNDEQKPFSDMGVFEAAIRAGKELADLTTQPLGPFSAAALLSIITQNARVPDRESIAIRDAPAAVPIAWRNQWMEQELDTAPAQLAPLIAALALATGSGDAEDWKPRFSRITGIDNATLLTPLSLALQVFRERLLLRAIAREQA